MPVFKNTSQEKTFDEGAGIARQGKVNLKLLDALKDNPFFSLPFPKTTGPELFNYGYIMAAKERSTTVNIPVEDTMTTLNKFTADLITSAIEKTFPSHRRLHVFVSGGGMHNSLLMERLQSQLKNCTIDTTQTLGVNPDAKEAVLFAVLANECVCGDPSIFGNEKQGIPGITMGKVSFPY